MIDFNKYDAVIFDLDGTLVDSMWIWKEVDVDYLYNITGGNYTEDLHKEIEGMSTTETATYFKEKFNIEDDIEVIKAQWIQMAEDYYRSKVFLKKGALELLEQLKGLGIKIGIGTSNFRYLAEEVLKSNDVIEYFDTIRTSCEFDNGKPFPDVFLGVADDLDVDPSRCLVFEDTHAGVKAANRAGMDVIGVRDEMSLKYREDIERDVIKYIEDFSVLLHR